MDSIEDSVRLEVVVNAPVITSSTSDQIIFNGDYFLLMCNANGIPEPQVEWLFNRTSVEGNGRRGNNHELAISAAIAADSGAYSCVAKNAYGETRSMTRVTVLAITQPKSRYFVRVGDQLVIQAPVPKAYLQAGQVSSVAWKRPGLGELNSTEGVVVEMDGQLTFRSISASSLGVYSLSLTSGSGRQRTYRTVVELKPDVWVAGREELTVLTGETVRMDCSDVGQPGSKRVWEKDGLALSASNGGRWEIRDKGLALVLKNATGGEDNGVFACSAVATGGGQDVLQFHVEVINAERPTTSASETLDHCHDLRPVAVDDVTPADNDTVTLHWRPPSASNCLSAAEIVWWTNGGDGGEAIYGEALLPLEASTFRLTTEESGYYAQVNLVFRDGHRLQGPTRSFATGSGASASGRLSERGFFNDRNALAAMAVASSAVVTVLVIFIVALLCYRRHARSASAYVCCCCAAGEKGRSVSSASSRKALGSDVYTGAIFQSEPVSPGDFMASLAPQWPEPEPLQPPTDDDLEVAHERNSLIYRRSQARSSISSSWGSLFNASNDQHHRNGPALTEAAAPSTSPRSSLLTPVGNGVRVSFAGFGQHESHGGQNHSPSAQRISFSDA